MNNQSVAGLSVILGQMVRYFGNRVDVEDLDVLNFSLYHLFCRIDYLYLTALPELLSTGPAAIEQTFTDDLECRQNIWSKLRDIKHIINRLEPLCNLLVDATRCILEALDSKDSMAGVRGRSPATIDENTLPRLTAMVQSEEQDWQHPLKREHREQALTALRARLSTWQQSYSQLAHFVDNFAYVLPAIPSVAQLDEVFNILLKSAGTIFREILPEAISASEADAAAGATLLFDLMQQADQLLLQFDTALEPLHALIEHFALMFHR